MATTKRSTSHPSASESTGTRKSVGKKAAKKSGRKYSPEASGYVEQEMKEMKEGKLKSGGSGKTVKNPKQAIAIGLSEARRAGKKVPAPPQRRAA
jgi:hypothetical protein